MLGLKSVSGLPRLAKGALRRSHNDRRSNLQCKSFSTDTAAPFRGKVFSLGENVEGQLGVSSPACAQPTPIEGLPEIVSMACGDMHSLIVDVNGAVWAFGASSFGETGLGVDVEIMPPSKINLDVKIVGAAAGKAHSLLLSENGEVYSFGDGESNQLGYAAFGGNAEPQRIDALKGVNVKKIVAGSLHNLVIDDKGTAYSWGSGHYAQHGQGKVDMVEEPTIIESLRNTPIRLASAGLCHCVVVTEDERVLIFGSHKSKLPGANLHRTHFFLLPTPVKNLELQSGEKWSHLSTGLAHNIISTTHGRTFAWGINTGWAVGSTESSFDAAVRLPALDGIVFDSLTSGSYHNMGFGVHGECWVWGQGSDYQLGRDRQSHQAPTKAPLDLPSGSRVRQIAGGWAHTLLLVDRQL